MTDTTLEAARGTDDDVITVIREDGSRDAANDPGLGEELLLDLYRCMVLLRASDEKCMQLQRSGRIGFYVPHGGEEAAQIGTAAAMRETDWIFPSYRAQGILLLRGASLEDMMAQLYGNRLDLSKGRQMPNHYAFAAQRFVSISSPIGTQIIQATGAAQAAKIQKHDTVVATLFGDGSTSSNDFHTGLNFAGVWKSPCIFICTNNGWAISMPLEQQTASETIAIKAQAYGMPGVRVDGNDVLACYAVMREACERARTGGGPTLIEAVTYRMGPHTSSDDPTRYRAEELVAPWRRRDPIERFEKMLEQEGLLAAGEADEMKKEAGDVVASAIAAVEKEPNPTIETMFEDVFEQHTPQLLEQLEELRAEQAGGTGETEEFHFPL